MLRNVICKSNHCVLKQFTTFKDCHHALPVARLCSAVAIKANERYLQQTTSTYFPYCVGSTRMNIRQKTTVAKEVGITKKDDPTDLQPKEIRVEPLTTREKLKKAVKEYGSTVIVFHISISLISLGTCYLLVSLGLDVAKIFEMLGIQEWLSKSQAVSNAGTFAVAYAIHKVFAPVRITITLASVPLIVRYLRRIGFLKK